MALRQSLALFLAVSITSMAGQSKAQKAPHHPERDDARDLAVLENDESVAYSSTLILNTKKPPISIPQTGQPISSLMSIFYFLKGHYISHFTPDMERNCICRIWTRTLLLFARTSIHLGTRRAKTCFLSVRCQ
ncbi:hypothetical protein LIA77_10897 [Sarocladium implicatum]|nr:hypothetical protein LIA77_10897 [Sarocladium implicatum]